MPEGPDPASELHREFDELRRELGLVPPDESPEDESVIPEVGVQDAPVAVATPVDVEDDEDEAPEAKTYPGSRRVRRSVKKAEEAPEPDPEDDLWSMPPLLTVQGIDLYPIGVLAKALKRSSATLRSWEQQGYLPKATYASKASARAEAEGTTKHGRRRLYTRQQIEGLRMLAMEEGLLGPLKKPRIDQTKFPDRARRLFEALRRANQ